MFTNNKTSPIFDWPSIKYKCLKGFEFAEIDGLPYRARIATDKHQQNFGAVVIDKRTRQTCAEVFPNQEEAIKYCLKAIGFWRNGMNIPLVFA